MKFLLFSFWNYFLGDFLKYQAVLEIPSVGIDESRTTEDKYNP